MKLWSFYSSHLGWSQCHLTQSVYSFWKKFHVLTLEYHTFLGLLIHWQLNLSLLWKSSSSQSLIVWVYLDSVLRSRFSMYTYFLSVLIYPKCSYLANGLNYHLSKNGSKVYISIFTCLSELHILLYNHVFNNSTWILNRQFRSKNEPLILLICIHLFFMYSHSSKYYFHSQLCVQTTQFINKSWELLWYGFFSLRKKY